MTTTAKDGKGLDYYSLQGKVVQMTKACETDYEIYADEGMLARVLTVEDDSHGDDRMVKIRLDFDEFKEYNEPLQKPNFYDRQGNPTETWYESGLYEDGKDTIYCMEDTEQHLPPFIPFDGIPVTTKECLDLIEEMRNELIGFLVDGFRKTNCNEMDNKAFTILKKAKRIT
jgi:hypothetical protein